MGGSKVSAMTNQQKLITLGAALHGRLWLRATARSLDVDYRQVQRWAKGEYAVPDQVIADLVKIASERKTVISGAIIAASK